MASLEIDAFSVTFGYFSVTGVASLLDGEPQVSTFLLFRFFIIILFAFLVVLLF